MIAGLVFYHLKSFNHTLTLINFGKINCLKLDELEERVGTKFGPLFGFAKSHQYKTNFTLSQYSKSVVVAEIILNSKNIPGKRQETFI
ncbi:hypothetical protein [Flavobacterium granuli]|uniref:Uncharacterized protein n=1 Tax=Flavobacterium granuli TaxID=280093 RepID=A0ABU1RX69_9FLAO|nr:hypothetical protein [Flavobacterium granuli]MDR6843353.1 hypothetical protein [Flavobacterium granuli]